MREWWAARPTWQKALIIVVGVLVIAAIVSPDGDEETTETTTPTTVVATIETTTTTTLPTTTTTVPTTTTTTVQEPEASDFQIELVVIEDQCFNTAGALVTVEPELSYIGPSLTRDYLVIYEISGVESGTATYNLTVHEDGTYTYNQEQLSTESCDHDLQVEVVGVRSR